MNYYKKICNIGGPQFLANLYAGNFDWYNAGFYFAIGAGDEAWDTTPVAPDGTEIALTSEVSRVVPYWKGFLAETMVDGTGATIDAYDNGKILWSSTQTKLIRWVAEFPKSLFIDQRQDGLYIREMGLFINAKSEKNDGYLVALVRHSKYWWSREFTLRRELIFDLRG